MRACLASRLYLKALHSGAKFKVDIIFLLSKKNPDNWKQFFCTEHGSITAVHCAKFQTDWTIETDVMDERDFARIEFKMGFGRISYIAQAGSGMVTHF